MERLIGHFRGLVEKTETRFIRYLYDKIDWGNRFIAILGARGVGKTTMLLQRIKKEHSLDSTLYINADDIYFTENKLFDLVATFHANKGKHLFIDEIHKYPDWSKELKMMYDYFPDLQVVFTGSSILDIYKGSDDLSRRVISYYMQGLSFREYVSLRQNKQFNAYSFEDIIHNRAELPGASYPIALFNEYLRQGYYPFFGEPDYDVRLRNVINICLEQDIPAFAKMNYTTSQQLKHLMQIISESVPFKPNFTKIGERMGVHRNQIANYFYFLERAGLIIQLRSGTKGFNVLGKVEKVFLENPNLMYALTSQKTNIGNVRETFFFNQMKLNQQVTSAKDADFLIDKYTFEVGGRGKTGKQIKNIQNSFLVKDDIEHGYMNIIPLWHFGLNY